MRGDALVVVGIALLVQIPVESYAINSQVLVTRLCSDPHFFFKQLGTLSESERAAQRQRDTRALGNGGHRPPEHKIGNNML